MSGLNRGNNDRKNTFSAALEAKSRIIDSLAGIELGNEPDSDNIPIRTLQTGPITDELNLSIPPVLGLSRRDTSLE